MKDEKIFLQHILKAVSAIEKYTSEIDEQEFFRNTLVHDAVIRQFEIIGEAAKNLSQKSRQEMAEVQWPAVAGMRNKLIHEYFGVDLIIVWNTTKEYLPILKKAIKRYLKQYPPT